MGLISALFFIGLSFALYRFSLVNQGGVVAHDFWSIASGMVVLALLAAYLVSAVVWMGFLNRFGMGQSFGQAILDVGILSVGKYIPGKIIGLMARGAVRDDEFRPTIKSTSISVVEQVVSLLIGAMTGFYLYLVSSFRMGFPAAALLVASYVLLCALMLRLVVWGVSVIPLLKQRVAISGSISHRKAAILGVGYGFTWIFTGLSLFPLLATELDVSIRLTIVSVFIVSMIAGWLAIFSPAGLGIREAVFTAMAGSLMGWPQALAVISIHRIICCMVDVLYGAACMLYVYFHFSGRRA